jgi:hypothetical protein
MGVGSKSLLSWPDYTNTLKIILVPTMLGVFAYVQRSPWFNDVTTVKVTPGGDMSVVVSAGGSAPKQE